MNPYQSPPAYDDEDEAENPIEWVLEFLFVAMYCTPAVAAYIVVIAALYPVVLGGFLLAPIVALVTPWVVDEERLWHRWWPAVPGAVIGAFFLPMYWRDGLLPSLFDFARKCNLLESP